MNKISYILVTFFLVSIGYISAQQNTADQIAFREVQVQKKDDKIHITMNVDLSKLTLKNNQQIEIVPVLVSKDKTSRWELPYLLIQGKTRNKVYNRKLRLHNQSETEKNAQQIVFRNNHTTQTLPYLATVNLQEEGMKKASLQVYTKVSGCAECDIAENSQLLIDRLLPEDFVPTYSLTYIVPEVEQVKARSEKYAAHFNYKVGRHELLRNYKDNAREFDKVARIINEIKNDKNLTITDFTISGYASPEGSFKSNLSLSQRRAEAFANYLKDTYGMAQNMFKVTWHGEDWNGLEKAVKSSSFEDKDAIIEIIHRVSEPDARDAHLKKLSGGKIYTRMLAELYPPLRRNEYTIAYVARAFDVEEAKQVIKTKPQLLSLNEMYLVAQTYPANSKEFKEVFDIAARMFPNEPIAIVNSAAADIEAGNNKSAIERLTKIANNPRVWNNLGVAYARHGDAQNAMKYLRKAAENGDKDAQNNVQQLQQFLDNK